MGERGRFRRYMHELGDDLRHELWSLKEKTGTPMSVHLREAVTVYLAVYPQFEEARSQEGISEYERHQAEGRVIFDHLRQVLKDTGQAK